MSDEQQDTVNELQMIEGDHRDEDAIAQAEKVTAEAKAQSDAPQPPSTEEVKVAEAVHFTVDTMLAEQPKLVKRPLDRHLERVMEVLLRRRDQVLGMADTILGLDGNTENKERLRDWLEQDFQVLIEALEFMPEPKKS